MGERRAFGRPTERSCPHDILEVGVSLSLGGIKKGKTMSLSSSSPTRSWHSLRFVTGCSILLALVAAVAARPNSDLRVEAAKLEQILNGLKSVSSNLESTLWGIGGARSARSGGMPEKSMGVFDAEDDYTDAASPDHRPDKRNYNLDHLARMNFRRSARNVNNFRDRDIPRRNSRISGLNNRHILGGL